MKSRRRFAQTAAVVCVAVGTAAVAAVLTLLDATLWRAPPFPDSERFVRVWLERTGSDPRVDLSITEAAEVGAALDGLGEYATAARSRVVARLPQGAERLRGEAVSANYFELLGLAPVRGRAFTGRDHDAGAEATALISNLVWRTRYGASEGVVGQVLVTGEKRYRIVGVLPPGFAGTVDDDEVEYWAPLAHYAPARAVANREARQTWTLLRLAPGVGTQQVQARLETLFSRWRAEHGRLYEGMNLRVEPFGETWRGPMRSTGALLAGAVALLLAIATVNVASLFLARGLERRRELALRAALGAGTRRLAWLLFREAALLVVVGGALGALLAGPLLDAFVASAPRALPDYLELHFDGLALLASAGVVALAALAAGTWPALAVRRIEPADALAAGSRTQTASAGERRTSRWLVAGQVTLTALMLACGALLLRSVLALSAVPLGFHVEGVLRTAVSFAPEDVAAAGGTHALRARLVEALRAVPGVDAVGTVAPTLPPWDGDVVELEVAGIADRIGAGRHAIDAGLLDTLGIRVLAGRGPEARDVEGSAPVAFVSAALAERLGGVEAALARELPDGHGTMRRVVGVLSDVAWDGVGRQDTGRLVADSSRNDLYVPIGQSTGNVVSIALRSPGDPAALIEPARLAIAGVAPGSAPHWTSTMADELAGEYAATRFHALLVVAFAAAALLLSCVGLFALLAQSVARRGAEIGLRMALGADAARVARSVVGEGMLLACAGLATGFALAALAAPLLQGFLFGVGALDPASFAAAAGLLLLVALVAVAVPARRAARIAPMSALRGD